MDKQEDASYGTKVRQSWKTHATVLEEEWTVSNNIEAKLCMFDGNSKPCLATVHVIAVLQVKLKKILYL